MPDLQLATQLPSRFVPRSRPYAHVVYEPSTSLIVAASVLKAKFASYDEDGNNVWEPDGENELWQPLCISLIVAYSTERFLSHMWLFNAGSHLTRCLGNYGWVWWLFIQYPQLTTIRFEFAPNEFVTALECVNLETQSTISGQKEFIAVGTTVDRGEDLAVKGAVSRMHALCSCGWSFFQAYVFELVEVVPDPRFPVKRWYKLKLRARDESKGPVTAICGINGYLVSSMGQKVCYSSSLWHRCIHRFSIDLCTRVWFGWTIGWRRFLGCRSLRDVSTSSQEPTAHRWCRQECLVCSISGTRRSFWCQTWAYALHRKIRLNSSCWEKIFDVLLSWLPIFFLLTMKCLLLQATRKV